MSWSSDINDWQESTFGRVRVLVAYSRAIEEWVELRDKLESLRATNEASAEECADVVITLAALTRSLGFDLAEMVERKMEINRARKWRVDESGKGYHVKDGQ